MQGFGYSGGIKTNTKCEAIMENIRSIILIMKKNLPLYGFLISDSRWRGLYIHAKIYLALQMQNFWNHSALSNNAATQDRTLFKLLYNQSRDISFRKVI